LSCKFCIAESSPLSLSHSGTIHLYIYSEIFPVCIQELATFRLCSQYCYIMSYFY
jgi:hypothetical protein